MSMNFDKPGSGSAPAPALSLKGLGVAGRLWISVAAVIVSLIGLIGFSSIRTSNLNAEAAAIDLQMGAKRAAAERWASMTTTNVTRVQAAAISTDPAVDALFKDEIAATIAKISEVQKAIEGMELTDKDKSLMARIADERKLVLSSLAKSRELKAAGKADEAGNEVRQTFNPAVAVYLKSLADFAAQQTTQKEAADAELAERRKVTLRVAMLVVVVIVGSLLAGAVWLVRSIKQPLSEALVLANHIAEGDLSASTSMQRSDEFGQLLDALNRMASQLRKVVGDVRVGVESVSTASAEIATGNHDLSARTEQTASSLQQTASSMEEITATVSQSADTARQANQLAASAAEAAARGGSVVEQVVGNMEQITASSKRISDIISVIDGIAFQTNILALNAAVEAARAGEQGRGFAVVASEVRSLAQRSAEAAKEIKGLINASVERVESGAALVNQTGTVMQEIVASVGRVSDMIGEIAASATEQRDGIAQVNVAVTGLDQMTQQNAALVEQSAAAASSLREQAQRLAEVVSVFRTGTGSSSALKAALAKPAGGLKPATVSKPPVAAPRAASPKPAATAAKPLAKPAGKVIAPPPGPPPSASPKPAPAPANDGDWETF
ncbi:methyl-accepting chemotaxis protein [Paucibacter sp. JuS9]|uniref:methyl-accepting chemotaxis protein n=1 Tax=Roseateles TaxID=93681 RepID=UPI002FE5BF8D